MPDPPLNAGAVQLTVALALPYVALAAVGASGMRFGVTEVEVELRPVPSSFVAVTTNTYEVPLVRPVMVQLNSVVTQPNALLVDVTS